MPVQCRASISWAQRLKRVSNIDIETCSECGSAVRVIACIEGPVVIEKMITHLNKKDGSAKALQLLPRRAPPQTGLFD